MRDAVSEPFVIDGVTHPITVSIGIAVSDTSGTGGADLIRDADIAMYRAKERGRNRCELFDDVLRKRILSNIHVENALSGALDRGELSLRYQPIVSLEDRSVEALEALLRWEHSGLGPVSPAEFIPIAEQCGLIVPIGEWVISEACRQAARWKEKYRDEAPLPINVNLSP